MKLPDGYISLALDQGAGYALAETVGQVAAIMEEGDTLHTWAAKREGRRELEGRGIVYDVPSPVDDTRWVVRHYRRGGWMRYLLSDRFLAKGVPRPYHELRANAEVRRRGIRTPRVLASLIYPATPLFYRADIVTERVTDARDLARVVFEDGDPEWTEACLTAAGEFVVSLENAGIQHPDLNAKNLLVLRENDAPAIVLLDLDRCSGLPEGQIAPRGPMRSRLRRSLSKLAEKHGRRMTQGEIVALARGLERT